MLPLGGQYQELEGYLERLRTYSNHIEICGEDRNSYAKTDHDATFMRIKRDYMGNDQLLPAYNVQTAICDEYIAVIDAKPFASDQDCFIPLKAFSPKELLGSSNGTETIKESFGGEKRMSFWN